MLDGGMCGWMGACVAGGRAWLGRGVHGWGGMHGPPYGWQVGGTHPTVMLTCFYHNCLQAIIVLSWSVVPDYEIFFWNFVSCFRSC